MNQRIQKLALQSYKEVIETHDYNGSAYTVREFDQEKFALLIVKECGVALSPMLRDMVSRGQAYDLIKKHFGVEE